MQLNRSVTGSFPRRDLCAPDESQVTLLGPFAALVSTVGAGARFEAGLRRVWCLTVLTGLVMRSRHRLMVCEKWRRAFLRLFHPATRNAAMRVLRMAIACGAVQPHGPSGRSTAQES